MKMYEGQGRWWPQAALSAHFVKNVVSWGKMHFNFHKSVFLGQMSWVRASFAKPTEKCISVFRLLFAKAGLPPWLGFSNVILCPKHIGANSEKKLLGVGIMWPGPWHSCSWLWEMYGPHYSTATVIYSDKAGGRNIFMPADIRTFAFERSRTNVSWASPNPHFRGKRAPVPCCCQAHKIELSANFTQQPLALLRSARPII